MPNTKKFLIFLILICSLVGISSAVGGFEDNLVGWSPGTAPFVDDNDPDSKKAVYIRTDEYYAGSKCAQITAWAKDYKYATMYLDYAFEVNFDNVDEITYYVKTDAVINHQGTAKFWCQIGDTRYNEVTSGYAYSTWTKKTIDTSSITGTKELSFVSTAISVSSVEEKYSMLLDNVAIDGVLIPYGFSNQRFYVYDSHTNLPIEDALVTVPASAEYSNYTNSAGYTDYFSNLLSVHTYNYNVQKTGYNTISSSFTTGIESSLTTNVALTSTATPTPPPDYGEDLIPTMTSDTTPSGAVFVSSTYTTNLGYYVFDDVISTRWISTTGFPQQVGYDFGLQSSVITTGYSLQAANTANAYAPKTFQFEASNNNQNWVSLDSQTGLNWTTSEKKIFSISQSGQYRYFRLNITDMYSAGGTVASSQLAEMEIYGTLYTTTPTPTPTTPAPTPTTPTPTPIPTSYNPTITNPSNVKESITFALASIFGISDQNNVNIILAAIIIGFFATSAAYITKDGFGFLGGGIIGFIISLGVGLIPLWIFFAIVIFAIIYFILKSGGDD